MRCTLRTLLALVAISGSLAWAAMSQAADAVSVAGEPSSPETIRRLIEQLGSNEFLIRKRAERELLRQGFSAYDALMDAAAHHDLEIAARARYLARQIQVQWVVPSDSAQVKTILRDFGEQPEKERLEKVGQLLKLPNQAGWEAVCRVILYDQSRIVAKQTAALLLDEFRDDDVWRQKAKSIRASLGESTRDAAAWIVTRVVSLDDADAALRQWSEHITAYRELRSTSDDTSPNLSLTLVRQEFSLLNRLGRRDEALESLRGMIALERGDPDHLAQMIDWLADEQAWTLVDELAERFDHVIAHNVKLAYQLAEVFKTKGDPSRADAIAARALQLNPDSGNEHFLIAADLNKRGLRDWAEAEYRRTIEIGPASGGASVFASVSLSDLLHDVGRELAAAEVLKKLLDDAKQNGDIEKILLARSRPLLHVRGNMEFYFSQHEHGQGNWEKEREHLDLAIAADPTNADVLIAMYRLPEASAEYHKSTLERIQRIAKAFRKQIIDDPDDPQGYNQLAWLIANTEGDFDEAVRCSHKSLELAPGLAVYLDTLGHCYFAKKDFENAVKYQQQAADLEPNMNLITKQLKVFKQALAESQTGANPTKNEAAP